MTPFWDMWRLLSNFGTKGAKIVIFLIGDQNRNILKLRGRKVQFSQTFMPFSFINTPIFPHNLYFDFFLPILFPFL